MQQVFITGASGFIGGHLVAALSEQDVRMKCLVRRTSRTEHLEHPNVQCVYGDLTDIDSLAEAVAGCDTVFHLAGLVCSLRYQDMVRINGQGSWNVAQACARVPDPPTLVAVSSIAASGPIRRGQVRTESDRATPISLYGRSKRAGELAVLQFADQIPVTIVRPGIVFGPRDQEFLQVMKTIRMFRAHVVPGLVTPPLSLIHVQDLVEVMIRAAERGRRCQPCRTEPHHRRIPLTIGSPPPGPPETELGFRGASRQGELLGSNGDSAEAATDSAAGVYFGVAPEHPDYAQVGHLLRPFLRRPAAWLVAMPTPLPWIFAVIAEAIARARQQADIFNLDKIREGTAESWVCSHQAVERELDYHFPVSLRKRFEQTAAWYFENGWL